MDPKLFWAIVAILGVAVFSMLLRRLSGEGSGTPPNAPPGTREPEDAGDDEPEDGEMLAIESDGHIWLPDRHGIKRFALAEPGEPVETGALGAGGTVSREAFESWRAKHGARSPQALPGDGLHAGDFTSARIVRGAPDMDPWRLETLARDGEYMPFAFETEEAARVALGLLESRDVVQRPEDDEGRPIPASEEDFREARLRWERTIEELAMSQDEEPEERA